MKVCITCKKEKELTEFNKNAKKPDGLQQCCRECTKEYSAKWYQGNADLKKSRSNLRRDKVVNENRARIIEYLKSHPCVDCGERRLACLEFDHVRGKKYRAISNMMQCGWTKLKAEIDKCDVRCANCHRIKTSKDQNWFTYEAAS